MSVLHKTFNGGTTNGAISVPGLKVGDMVLFAGATNQTQSAVTNSHAGDGFFESFISVADEIQQIVGFNLSSVVYATVLFRSS